MTPKRKTWMALGAGLFLLGVLAFFGRSQRPPVPLRVIQVTTNLGLYGRMALLSDGTVCVADSSTVRAFDRDGQERWGFSWPINRKRSTRAEPSLVRLGGDTVLSVFHDGNLRSYGLVALRGGKPLWEKIVDPNLYYISTSRARSNEVILLAAGRAIIALDARGEELWHQTTATVQYLLPAENVLGELLHCDRDGTNWTIVLRSAEDGQELRRIGWGTGFNAADPDRCLYTSGNVSNGIASLATNLTERGSLGRPEWALCDPAIAPDGTIYLTARVKDSDPVLLAVHPEGRLLWSFGLSWGWALAAPVLGRDGTIYLVTGDRWVRAINPDGTLKWSHRIPAKLSFEQTRRWKHFTMQLQNRFGLRKNELFGQPVLSPDGRLFVNFNHTGSIYVFDTENLRGN